MSEPLEKVVENVSFNPNKLLPWFAVMLAIVSFLYTYGRNSNASDQMKIDMEKQQSKIEDLYAKMAQQSERIKALEVKDQVYANEADARIRFDQNIKNQQK